MQWTDAKYAGATDGELVQWARRMWWCIWARQAAVNYIGRWRRRFAREGSRKVWDVEVKEGARGEVAGGRVEKVRRRLSRLNEGLMSLGSVI